ncbi:hypothetical protein D3C87_1276860 [compost metagenome]
MRRHGRLGETLQVLTTGPSNLGGYVATAIILRCTRKVRGAEDRVWYEYAPIINGEARRRPTHMMGSVESASDLATKSGFTVHPDVLDVRVP